MKMLQYRLMSNINTSLRCRQLAILFVFFCVGKTMGADPGLSEWIPPYTIEKRSMDKSIPKTKSEIRFKFFNHRGGRLVKGPVTLHANKNKYSLCPDSNGVATLTLKPGKYKFYTYAFNYTEIAIDTLHILPQEKIEISVRFENDHEPMPVRKPVIYLYPEKTTDIQINLEAKGKVTFTYPQYNNGWNVTAHPDGTIEHNGKLYKYLFWEGQTSPYVQPGKTNEGSLVGTDTLLSFLEHSLTTMGLNAAEQQDFITYWYPLMVKNKANVIRFVMNNDCNAYANLNITPAPNNLYRVYILWCEAGDVDVTNLVKQSFPVLKREGFTVIEWGGIELTRVNLAH